MVCCTIIAALLGLFMRPFLAMQTSPLAWRPGIAVMGNEPQTMRAAGRLQSFAHAMDGLAFLVRNEPNMRIHLGLGAVTVIAQRSGWK